MDNNTDIKQPSCVASGVPFHHFASLCEKISVTQGKEKKKMQISKNIPFSFFPRNDDNPSRNSIYRIHCGRMFLSHENAILTFSQACLFLSFVV